MMREHFRGILEWNNEGNNLTTPSNNACKLFDACLSQYTGWYEDSNYGGLKNCLNKMLEEDPEFVMGRCLNIGLNLMGTATSIHNDKNFVEEIKLMNNLAENNKNLKIRELKHVEAVNKWSIGDYTNAYTLWEEILIDNPTDMLAIKFLHDTYFYLGLQEQLRDTVGRILPFWQSSSIPLKSYLHGMYAFGLQETHLYEKASQEAKRGLELCPQDGWALHALGHCYQTTGMTKEGKKLYETRKDDWLKSDTLAVHNFWHYGLYHLENGEYEEAFSIYEKNILPRVLESKTVFNIVDYTSFLYRLELLDEKRRLDKWNIIHPYVEPRLNDHIFGFNDLHYMMSCLGNKRLDQAEQLIETLDKNHKLYPIVKDILNAMIAFECKKYDTTVELLLPIKYEIVKLGGSDAQRDVFSQLLLMSAIKSKKDYHRKLAEHLIIERNQFKNVTPSNNLLIERLNN